MDEKFNMADEKFSSSLAFSEINEYQKVLTEVEGGNCGSEPTETQQVIQNGLEVRLGLTTSETWYDCLEQQGLMSTGKEQFDNCSGNSNLETVGKNENENGPKRSYSRNEMESFRFLNIEQQHQYWNEIYHNLQPAIAREYEGLADTKNQKQTRGKRKANAPIRNVSKCKENVPILGEVCYQTTRSNLGEDIGGDNCSQGLDSFREKKAMHCACQSPHNDEAADCNTVDNDFEEGIRSGSEDEYDSIQRPAFLVEGDPDFDSGSPQDGLEYLRRVRWEAAQIPKVKVAKLDKVNIKSEQTVYMPIIPDIAKCPDHLLPSKDWEDLFLTDFSELRLALARHDSLGLENSDGLQKHFNTSEDSSSFFSEDPMISTVLRMDAVSRASMLRSRIKAFEGMSSLSRKDCAWLYALCAVVDTPLNADTGASLRCLLRKCAKLRSEKPECDDELVMLNILVTISGRYFGQAES